MTDDSDGWEQEYWPDTDDEEEEERRRQEEEDDYWDDFLFEQQLEDERRRQEEENDYLIDELYRQQEEGDWEDHVYRHSSTYRRQPYLRSPSHAYYPARQANGKLTPRNVALIALLVLFGCYVLSII